MEAEISTDIGMKITGVENLDILAGVEEEGGEAEGEEGSNMTGP
jgi:hypothetical protein